MNNTNNRILRFSGAPYDIGYAAGRELGVKIEETINRYVAGMRSSLDIDTEKLHAGALPWLRSLPQRFQEEYQGMAEGANLSLQCLAEWSYIEECETKQCSGAVYISDNRAWVARNNDAYVPELWGYATIRAVDGRIPTIGFSMQGDVSAPTGVNRERLWLHYNFLPVWDHPAPGKPHLPGYVFVTEALEFCRNLSDVEAFLNDTDRDGGMLLFAVVGMTNEAVLFDCMCSKFYRRELTDGWIVGTNHYCACKDETLPDDGSPVNTLDRFRRMEDLIRSLSVSQTPANLPDDLIHVLADDQIERREGQLITAYANVACPNTGEIWYTFGGYPAASKGNWQKLEWPWAADLFDLD